MVERCETRSVILATGRTCLIFHPVVVPSEKASVRIMRLIARKYGDSIAQSEWPPSGGIYHNRRSPTSQVRDRTGRTCAGVTRMLLARRSSGFPWLYPSHHG